MYVTFNIDLFNSLEHDTMRHVFIKSKCFISLGNFMNVHVMNKFGLARLLDLSENCAHE